MYISCLTDFMFKRFMNRLFNDHHEASSWRAFHCARVKRLDFLKFRLPSVSNRQVYLPFSCKELRSTVRPSSSSVPLMPATYQVCAFRLAITTWCAG